MNPAPLGRPTRTRRLRNGLTFRFREIRAGEAKLRVDTVAVTATQANIARKAFRRYGRGRHGVFPIALAERRGRVHRRERWRPGGTTKEAAAKENIEIVHCDIKGRKGIPRWASI